MAHESEQSEQYEREYEPFDEAASAQGIAFYFATPEDRAALVRAVLRHGELVREAERAKLDFSR
jgi:hypothetical protein